VVVVVVVVVRCRVRSGGSESKGCCCRVCVKMLWRRLELL
jgi:hypothetical protein